MFFYRSCFLVAHSLTKKMTRLQFLWDASEFCYLWFSTCCILLKETKSECVNALFKCSKDTDILSYNKENHNLSSYSNEKYYDIYININNIYCLTLAKRLNINWQHNAKAKTPTSSILIIYDLEHTREGGVVKVC